MSLPPPLTPADCDLRDFQRMMIDISRLRQSRFDAVTADDVWRAGFNLWFSAWHAVPAGSLENDDDVLCKAAGLARDLRTWKKIKEKALRGFIECSDGRLYHKTVSEFALEAWIEKLIQRLSSGAGNAKRWRAEFDPSPIEAALFHAGNLLAALAPSSKAVMKSRRRGPRQDSPSISPGSETSPAGIDPASGRDGKGIPPGSLEKGTGTGTGTETGKEVEEESVASATVAKSPAMPLAEAFAYWNEIAGSVGWPTVIKISSARQAALRARLRGDGLDGWRAGIDRARSSPFLAGQPPPSWFTFDWIVKPGNFAKLIEGNYDGSGSSARSGSGFNHRERPSGPIESRRRVREQYGIPDGYERDA